jgi:hypothetical protein
MTLTDINYQQVLNNVAMFTANPGALPSFAVVNAGTVTVTDQKTATGQSTYAPTLVFPQQNGAGLPILSLTPGFNLQRQVSENWSMVPVTDADHLRRVRCAFQLLVTDGQDTYCEDCVAELREFFLGQQDKLDCIVPRGWYCVGRKKDVPKECCLVGCYCDTYVWVPPEGLDGLSRFTLTVLDLATGKPQAPQRTVQRTYKADGSLDNTQVTTTEIDPEALRKLRERGSRGHDRSRESSAPNRGLFFIPD